MTILHIEHAVADFDAWKRAFENDPLQREKSGVQRYRISRPLDDPKYVTIDLEFNGVAPAQAMLSRLRELWGKVDVIREPQARILDAVEIVEYRKGGA